MSDEPKLPAEETADAAGTAAPAEPAPAEALSPDPVVAPSPEPVVPSSSGAAAAQRPEVAVGAAFAGGLLAALILKRLAR